MQNIIADYYNRHAEQEWQRLEHPFSKIEYYCTLNLLDKYFPKNGFVCDIGAGPGKYSIELLQRGYKVDLFDISEKSLALAESKIKKYGLKANNYICDNAINLSRIKDNTYDIVLLMGPLYHLQSSEDRVHVLKETKRILKKSGMALISYINSWGCLKAGVSMKNKRFSDINYINNLLNPQLLNESQSFTEVYFSTPNEALKEVEDTGFNIVTYAGAEGFLGGMKNQIMSIYNEDQSIYQNLIEVCLETCELSPFRDATEHIQIIVKNN